MRPTLTRDLIRIEPAPPGGGVPVVTLPTVPVATLPTAPIPTPPLPSPPSPILPTPGIETADTMQFTDTGNGPSPVEELYQFLGLLPDVSEPLLTPIFGGGSYVGGGGGGYVFVPDVHVNDWCDVYETLC